MDCNVWAVGPCPALSLLKTVINSITVFCTEEIGSDQGFTRINNEMSVKLFFSPFEGSNSIGVAELNTCMQQCVFCVCMYMFGHLIVTGPKSVASKTIHTLHSLRCTIVCHKREMFHWFITEMRCHTLPTLPQVHWTFSKPWTTPLLIEVQKVPTRRGFFKPSLLDFFSVTLG